MALTARRLQGMRVLVTGAGTGIGSGIARVCAEEGAKVAIHYSHSQTGARETAKSIESAGGEADIFQADLADLSNVKRMAREALQFLGGVDVLVNNAGITFNAPLDQVTPDQFDRMYQVNVRGPFFLIQSMLASLRQSRGSVVNITSIHAFQGMQEHAVYAGTKGAIVASTRAMAIELSSSGVRVNAIAPGCVPVANYEKAIGAYDVEEIGRNIPVGYVGRPEDIGKAVVFLASEDGRFIDGQTLVIDGGTSSWIPFGDQYRQPLAARGQQFGGGYIPGVG